MSPTPDSTLDDPQQTIADLQRELANAQQRLEERTAERDEAQAQQAATAEVLQVINSSPGDLASVLDAILAKAMHLCRAAFGVLWTYDGEYMHAVATRGVPAQLIEFLRQGPHPPARVVQRSLVGGAPYEQIADLRLTDGYLAGEPIPRAGADLGGVRTLLGVALRKNDKLLGIFGIYRQEVRPFSDKQIALLQNFAAQAVIAIENARLLTETREALEQQTATAEVLQVINSSPGDLAPVFDAMLVKALRLCGAAFGTLNTYDGQHFRHAANRGASAAWLEWLQKNPSGLAADGTLMRVPLAYRRLLAGEDLIHDLDLKAQEPYRDGDPNRRALVDLAGARTHLALALRKDETLLGGLTIYRKEVRPFTDKQIALLQNFAAQAVIAIENARLLSETREALEQQTATAEVLQVINSSPGDLTPVFDAILEKAHSLCGAYLGSLFTYDGECFWPVAGQRPPPQFSELMREGFRPGPGNPFSRVLEGEPLVHIADIRPLAAEHPDDAGLHVAVEVGLRTFMVVPLRKDNVLLGVITANRREVRPFSDKQIALLQNFAVQAVIAMENARLITETREALEQQTATSEVLGVINSSPGDLKPVFEAILEKAHTLCDAATGSLRIIDGDMIRAVAFRGQSGEFADQVQQGYPFASAPLFASLRDGAPFVHISDVAERDDPISRLSTASGNRTILAVPLRKDDALLGMIVAGRKEVRPFTDKQIALLQNFAAQAVIAMENARLLGELRQRTDEVGELNRGLEARVAEQVDELGRVGRLKRFLAPQLAELIVSQGDEKILESHRREIVVVFCDLRGYTAFTETAEPEEVLDFLRQYHGALGPLVSQFEGTLDQFSGDGIMVFFNDPVPCPDPAERAVNMAVAMRSAANTLIADWRERGRDLGFGAGIAQGYATLGQIGFSERSGYTAIGTVCNVAARLCAEAKDGQILLSQLVNVALRGSVTTEQLGPLTLKGLTQPVVAYNVPLAAIQPALRVIEGGSPQTV
jgi:GAF domain-containing protein